MLRAIIVDDEISGHILLKRAIKSVDGVEVVGSYMQPSALLNELKEVQPDIAFLDIEMAAMNGLELAEKIHEVNNQISVIFVTAFSRYAIDAFKVNALDYLLKPVDPKEVERVLNKVLNGRKAKIQPIQTRKNQMQLAQCFGFFEVYGNQNQKPVQWITSKVEELFAYLILYNGKLIEKWKLCELLWPNTSSDNAQTNLHTTVYRLRKTVKNEGIPVNIYNRNGGYIIEFESCFTDIQRFQQYYKDAKAISGIRKQAESIFDIEKQAKAISNIEKQTKAISNIEKQAKAISDIEQQAKEIEVLKSAVNLFQGELFSNKYFEWAMDYRETVNRQYIHLSYRLALLLNLSGNIEYEIEILKKLIKYFPYEEEACLMLLKLYEEGQDKLGLIHFYKSYKEILIQKLDCRPSKKIQARYDYIIERL